MGSNRIRALLVFSFGVVAAITGLLAWQNYEKVETSEASFLETEVSMEESPDPIPLVPVEAETFSQNAPVIINISYTPESISLDGTVNSEPLATILSYTFSSNLGTVGITVGLISLKLSPIFSILSA